MFEDFKEKIKEQNEKLEHYGLSAEVVAKFKEQGIDSATVTLDELYPETLDKEGNDLSLMSGYELEIWTTYCKTRHYLTEKYPLPEANPTGQQQAEASDESPQIDLTKAQTDPKIKIYFEALDKMILILGKLLVLQTRASSFEKTCLRHYSFITYNWMHASNVEEFRSQLSDRDLFEAVDSYFRICQKHHVPTLEEPYYFLPEKRRLDIKLEGDMLKRTGSHSENEIRISILEDFQ
jgi:hypothetical protein